MLEIKEKPATETYRWVQSPSLPLSLRAESLYQCRRAHLGHRSLKGRRPLTSQGDGRPCQRPQKHQNSLHVCTAICTQLHIKPLLRQGLGLSFCLGRYIYLTSLYCQKIPLYVVQLGTLNFLMAKSKISPESTDSSSI